MPILNLIYLLGGLGQLGTGLAQLLRKEYGTENIILSDIIKPSKEVLADGKIFSIKNIVRSTYRVVKHPSILNFSKISGFRSI